MGKSEANLQEQQQQQQQQRQTQEAQNSSGLICPRCSVVFRKIGKELSFRCVAVLILSFSILLSGIFWIPHYYANSSQFDAKEEIKLSGEFRSTYDAYLRWIYLDINTHINFILPKMLSFLNAADCTTIWLEASTIGRFTDKDKIDENTTLKDLDLTFEFHMDKLLREALFKAPEDLKGFSQPPATTHNHDSLLADDGELLIPPKGILLVTHEPGSVSTAPGPHIRGSPLKAYSLGDKEVDLLLPGIGRLRVQLGVNMPALAKRKHAQEEVDSTEVELFEFYHVVLYMGIIDILQEYNVEKKLEHAYKSLKNIDPQRISAVEPELYAKRFINFMKSVFPNLP